MAELPESWINPYPELTEKQAKFVFFYAFENIGAKSARKAGYSKKTAGQTASKLLKDGRVAARIEEFRAELRDRHAATADNIVERYRKMAMHDPLTLVVLDDETGLHRFKRPDELTPDEKGMIADVSIRTMERVDPDTGRKRKYQEFSYKLVNIKDALDSLSRTFGMFRDRVEHEHSHKITQLFKFVANNPENSETVAMLDRKYPKGALINGETGVVEQ